MTHFVGIDVSLETSSICIVDATGLTIRELIVESDPEALAAALLATGLSFARVGLEAGPLSQWLYAGLTRAGLPAILIETRRLRAATKTMPVKTDRNDARHRTGGAHGLVQSRPRQIRDLAGACEPC